jgi:hypothetical protein
VDKIIVNERKMNWKRPIRIEEDVNIEFGMIGERRRKRKAQMRRGSRKGSKIMLKWENKNLAENRVENRRPIWRFSAKRSRASS